ncbi:hypothetical protein [Rhodoferax sp.]|uniref:hypothetical protein n=1 Tax=Rhodoferax sp. TaxID=50421 RepID=UPI00374C9F3E
MSSALLAVPAILAPLQTLWRWLMPALPSLSELPTTLRGRAKPPHQPRRHNELTWRAGDDQRHGTGKRATPSHASAHRPLRIVRVMEAGQASTQVGRMVISGRMADVCAELDRLAACEAALS